tara:strand:- start:814 stop:1308 length:495 start_codon:yes stop_codon:yes gene_type:complete
MTVTTLDDATIAGATGVSLNQMNSHINQVGAIKPSSPIIKGWHDYDNVIWKCIFSCARILIDQNRISVPNYVDKDIDFLLTHIEEYGVHHNNVLYPTIKDTGTLPGAITHTNKAKYAKTVKSRTFRTMMNIRESLNAALDIDLPNEDGSRGRLTPSPKDTLFEI